MTTTFMIGPRRLSPDDPPYIVAEIGVNHDGRLDQARAMISAAAQAGADAAKFQTFQAAEFMADRDLTYEYEAGGERVRESMYAMFKRLELPRAWHTELQTHARTCGLDFLSSAADPLSADLLAELGVPALKLASEDLINLPLLRHVAGLHLPVILSTGMADEAEIERALTTLHAGGCDAVLLLHCVSLYPTPDDEANLLRMVGLRERFGLPVGYSDHTRGSVASIAAAALGAVLIEKHFTLDHALPGPDHAFSADPQELAALVRDVRRAAQQRGTPALEPSPGERLARQQFRRSVVAACDLAPGTCLAAEMLCVKRPGTGIAPHRLGELVGRRTRRHFAADEPLCWEDVE